MYGYFQDFFGWGGGGCWFWVVVWGWCIFFCFFVLQLFVLGIFIEMCDYLTFKLLNEKFIIQKNGRLHDLDALGGRFALDDYGSIVRGSRNEPASFVAKSIERGQVDAILVIRSSSMSSPSSAIVLERSGRLETVSGLVNQLPIRNWRGRGYTTSVDARRSLNFELRVPA